MKRFFTTMILICLLCLCSCKQEHGTVYFHEQPFQKADLSQSTIEWLQWYNTLSEEDQLSVNYVPIELRPQAPCAPAEITAIESE